MTTISNLVPLHDGRPGLRTLLQIEAREPVSEIRDNPCNPGLDFISSTATLDRYHEIIDPAGASTPTAAIPFFQNAHSYGDILFTLGKALLTEVRNAGSAGVSPASSSPHLFQRVQFATDVNPKRLMKTARTIERWQRLGYIPFIKVWAGSEEREGRSAIM